MQRDPVDRNRQHGGLGASLTHKARQDTKSIKIWTWLLFSYVKFKQIPIDHFSGC